jgi:hypothetical protein
MFLVMGTWVVQSDRETGRRRRELRKWILEKTEEQRKENEIEVLDRGGFSFAGPEKTAHVPVEIDFTVDQLNIFQSMFQRGVTWPNLPTEEQEEEVDELEADVAKWQKQEAADRALRTLTREQRKRLKVDITETEEEP